MSEKQAKFIKSSSGMAAATFLSRILGLFREMLLARTLGGGLYMTAWGLAFTVPNLFRRILGEGAVGTALVPLLRHTIEKDGKIATKLKLASIIAFVGVLLAFISIGGGVVALVCYHWVPASEKIKLTLMILPLVMPYAFFICLTGILGSVLNCLGRFFFPALAALLLNVCLIATLFFSHQVLFNKPLTVLYALSFAVLIAGILQLGMMTYLLYREKMMPDLRISQWKFREAVGEITKMALPGLIGASALQISLVVDRLLACYLSDYAVPSLIFSDRIVYLPIGVFAVSMGAVALSRMSREAAENDLESLKNSLIFGLKQLLFICIPIAIFTIIFRYPLIRLFYYGGRFGEKALEETAWALQFYAIGIPAFAAIKINVGAFYSRKNMMTPVKISVLCIITNIILNLILMWPLRQGGIALATVIACFLNNLLLLALLKKELKISMKKGTETVMKSLVSTIPAVVLSWLTYSALNALISADFFLNRLILVAVPGSVFVITYLFMAIILKASEITEIAKSFRPNN